MKWRCRINDLFFLRDSVRDDLKSPVSRIYAGNSRQCKQHDKDKWEMKNLDAGVRFHGGLTVVILSVVDADKKWSYILFVQSDRMAGGEASRSKVCVFPPFGRLSC